MNRIISGINGFGVYPFSVCAVGRLRCINA